MMGCLPIVESKLSIFWVNLTQLLGLFDPMIGWNNPTLCISVGTVTILVCDIHIRQAKSVDRRLTETVRVGEYFGHGSANGSRFRFTRTLHNSTHEIVNWWCILYKANDNFWQNPCVPYSSYPTCFFPAYLGMQRSITEVNDRSISKVNWNANPIHKEHTEPYVCPWDPYKMSSCRKHF